MVGHKLSISGLRDESFFFMGLSGRWKKLEMRSSNAQMKVKGKVKGYKYCVGEMGL